jgi:hypothetical protein
MQAVRLDTPLRCRRPIEKTLEDAPGYPNDPFVLPDSDCELDGRDLEVPPGVGGETKNMLDLLGGRKYVR